MSIEATVDDSSSALNSLSPRLHELLHSCASSLARGDVRQAERIVIDLGEFLNAISDAAENEDTHTSALEVLSQIYEYISSSSVDQEVIDALSFELPKAVSKFSAVSSKFSGIAQSIIDQLLRRCSPRDLLSIFCEALDSPSGKSVVSGYYAPLLSGLARVFLLIKRRQFNHIKEAVPVILRALENVSSDEVGIGPDMEDLFSRGINIARSVQTLRDELEGELSEKLGALLGLYVLHMMAIVSICMADNVSSCLRLVCELSQFFRCCNLSYAALITGSSVDKITSILNDEEEDSFLIQWSRIKLGAVLSVLWGHISHEVSQHAGENLTAVKNEIRNNRINRWRAIGMLWHVFSSAEVPWRLKKHAIDFVLCVTEGDALQECHGESQDFLSFVPSLFAALQGIMNIIIYAADAALRKRSFVALKTVLADIPVSPRFDIIKALITNSNSSSMIAILLDYVREVRHVQSSPEVSEGDVHFLQAKEVVSPEIPVWSAGVLELVELVLRPSKGGPPCLPERSDAVLSALNLFRFVLLSESTGKTNYTGVMSKTNLQKAYDEWLLPLRTLVTGILAENKNDCDQFSNDVCCALNPLEMVLYRCIELVEENLKPHV